MLVVVLLFVVCFWVFVCLVCLFRWWLEFECIAGSGGVLGLLFRWFKLLVVCMALIAAVCWFGWFGFVLMV